MYTMRIEDEHKDMILSFVGDDIKWIVKTSLSHMKGYIARHGEHDLWAFLYRDNKGYDEYTQFVINMDDMFVSYNYNGNVVVNARKG